MALTGPSPVVGLGVLAAVVFVLIVIGIPNGANRMVAGASRAVEVITLNVLVIALCGALLNDQYLFYSSWSDLFGARSSEVVLHHGGSANRAISARLKGGVTGMSSPATLPPLPSPGHRMQSYLVSDQSAYAHGQVLVYLPVGFHPGSAHKYPVVVGLHGFPSGPRSFAALNFLSTIDTLTAQHRLAPSIVVIPRIDTPSRLDTECTNGGPGEPQTDTWLAHDLPHWVVDHFPVQKDRTSWAAVGYSYGAWCAASLSMRHPDVFGAAIVLLGYFRPDFSRSYDPLNETTSRGYDLVRIEETAPPPISMWLLTTREDALSFPSTSKFLSVARPPTSVTATVLARGGHRNNVFTPYVPRALAWLGRTLPGFHG
ncbi:alpha/beta hydrolase [Pedococcus sp. 5OH_020]|uniref:alpha/beta hydrolase n=1 Tax=Pedococcus sp. 5OH_020 TaxID=2989814 RepID=UPI0022E9A542|nr:alpha/beta hydrolase-fold protein [Pedococcus sp. 5OH_020]